MIEFVNKVKSLYGMSTSERNIIKEEMDSMEGYLKHRKTLRERGEIDKNFKVLHEYVNTAHRRASLMFC